MRAGAPVKLNLIKGFGVLNIFEALKVDYFVFMLCVLLFFLSFKVLKFKHI